MVSPLGPIEDKLVVKFGGGLHTRASEDEIDPREAAGGKNFSLDPGNRELRNRKPFDLVGTSPNAGSIRGGGSYIKADGTVSFLIQAGDTVYEWDGAAAFTAKATVNALSQLRGHWDRHSWILDDKLLFTDLALLEEVKEWDGTTFQDVTFLKADESTPFGTFFAKYLIVTDERALFAHVKDGSVTSPHMMVGGKRSDFTIISNTGTPAGADSPFFLLAPDLRPVNGLVEAFGTTIISTENGRIFNLTGTGATDFVFNKFYPGSAASGTETVAYIGNDIIYGRRGRIESIRDTDRSGDVESDDLTFRIAEEIETYTGWTVVYNARLNRFYAFPDSQAEVWVAQTAMLRGNLSPWTKWTTSHALAFQPTFAMSMIDPQDKLEYIFMGDSSGCLYRKEGSGASGDGGTASIATEWLSRLFTIDIVAQQYNIEGWVKYRKGDAATVTLTLLFSGTTAFNESVTIDIPAVSNRPVYGGSIYYNNSEHYGTAFSGRLVSQKFGIPGQSEEFQVKAAFSGTGDLQINEVGLQFTAVD